MLSTPVAEALNAQIGVEFSASQHYLAIAGFFARRSLTAWADFFFAQAEEERLHAMKILTWLLDNDVEIHLPAVAEARSDFADARAAVASALESERRVSKNFDDMAFLAAEQRDFRGQQFLQWFINEQVEEEATMGALLDLIDSGINLFQAQQYLPTQSAPGASDPAGEAPA